jgi:hypothetical protein
MMRGVGGDGRDVKGGDVFNRRTDNESKGTY